MSLCFQTNIPGLPEHTSQNRCLINSNRLGKPSQQILSVCFCARCCRSCEDQIHLEGIVPFLCMGACVFVSEAPSLLSRLVSVTPQGWTGGFIQWEGFALFQPPLPTTMAFSCRMTLALSGPVLVGEGVAACLVGLGEGNEHGCSEPWGSPSHCHHPAHRELPTLSLHWSGWACEQT